MPLIASPDFTAISLHEVFNARRVELPPELTCPAGMLERYGDQLMRGMTFSLGVSGKADVVLLDAMPVTIDLKGMTATYIIFLHAVEESADMSRWPVDREAEHGYKLGELVSDYQLHYEDGTRISVPVLRRFAIQQSRSYRGSAPFACIPAEEDIVRHTADEELALRGEINPLYGIAPTRTVTKALDTMRPDRGLLWIYALPNPHPTKPLRELVCHPREQRSVIYAVTVTKVSEHPLRPGVRQKLRLSLPAGVGFNAIDEVDDADIGIDLGVVISARRALDYDEAAWLSGSHLPVVEPKPSSDEAIVEFAAHAEARLVLGERAFRIASPPSDVRVLPAVRPVRLRFVDGGSHSDLAVRLHLHGQAGEYLPPRGHHRKVNRTWAQDNAAEFASGYNQYAYVDGECVADLPIGAVYVEATCGLEFEPVRTRLDIGSDTDEIVIELQHTLDWRAQGWVTADTHVHLLSPQTALLEGRAEGVNVVNLLASQWGEMFSNVGDFDGKTTFGAEDLGGRGEFLVRVGSENRSQVMGHISLLGYRGPLILPLCTGGPDESAFGDALEQTTSEWARRCREQGGLVVLPHSPTPQLERAANIVLDLVNAIELMGMNPLGSGSVDPASGRADIPSPLTPWGITDWYRYLNLGYHLPLVGGTDKMDAGALLGGVRTYAKLPCAELTFENWMAAVKSGNTFVTAGPLCDITVDGVSPGGQVHLPSGGGRVDVNWLVESLSVPVFEVEIIVSGMVHDRVAINGRSRTSGHLSLPIPASSWVALRVRGSWHGRREHIAAHTSAIQVLVDGTALFRELDSVAVLNQIQGAIAYVDTIAPRPDLRTFQTLRMTLERAYSQLHRRMHAAGVPHAGPLHEPDAPHEH